MKRNDWILIGIVLTVAACLGLVQFFKPTDSDAMIEITVNGEIYEEYSLTDNITVSINSTNELVIKDGEAKMVDASCPDHLCVQQKAISKNGESIICLPNKVAVTVIGGKESEIDAISN